MSKPDTWKAWEGRVVEGKYPLRQWLGGSGHSAVFLTEFAERPSQRVAIKLIRVDEGNGEPQLSQLQVTKKLSHPHLIRTFHPKPPFLRGFHEMEREVRLRRER